jgi:hypothetical protein
MLIARKYDRIFTAAWNISFEKFEKLRAFSREMLQQIDPERGGLNRWIRPIQWTSAPTANPGFTHI